MERDLEAMIDKHSLSAVIDAIGMVCGAKSEHILANWQDKIEADRWTCAKDVLDATASRVSELGLS